LKKGREDASHNEIEFELGISLLAHLGSLRARRSVLQGGRGKFGKFAVELI
jgi:hypothetical protein